MTLDQQKSILTIALLAAFADGNKDDTEREEIRRLAQSLAGDAGMADLPRIYQDVLLQRTSVQAAASALGDPMQRQLAYEMAVCVCDVDGRQTAAERDFLATLKTVLQLDAQQTAAFDQEADALVDVAERPIVEAGRLEIDKPARSIDIMTGRAVEAGVHQPDIDPIGKRRAKLGQQALGRLRSRKAQAVHGDRKATALDLNGLGATGKHLHRRRQDEFLGDARQGIMIAADDVDRDIRLSKPLHLTGQKPRGLHRRLVAIIKIAGNHQRIDLFGEAQIDDGHERLARGVTNQVGERAVAQGQRAQWRIEVNIGGVNEAESHQRFILFLVIAVNPLIEAVGPAVTHRI